MRALVIAVVALLLVVVPDRAGATNLLKNGGFESPDISRGGQPGAKPDGWFAFASVGEPPIGVTDSRRREAVQCLKFRAPNATNAFAGLGQTFDVVGEHRYSFSVYVMNDPSDPLIGASFGQVSLEWKDSAGTEIGRTYGPTWNFGLSPTRWERFLVEGEAPAEAVSGVAVITFFTKNAAGRGTFYVDSCELTGGPSRP